MAEKKRAATPNHKPQRTCMGCRQVDIRLAMVRLAAQPQGVILDLSCSLGGRGGYLHLRRECLQSFVKAKTGKFRSLGCVLDRSERVNLVKVLAEQLEGAEKELLRDA